MKDASRIPSLDGMRAVSIALVIIAHAGLSLPFLWRFDFGNLGVRVFFVISGFLITKLLLEERSRTGHISIPKFYLRRAFRILPAAYVYLAIAALLIPYGMHALYSQIAPVAFYYADYPDLRHPLGTSGIAMGQFWSLSVEEQFYLFWPVALVLLGTRRSTIACAALLITAPVFRLLCDLGIWPTSSRYAFECVCDALATGCLLAILRCRLWENRAYRGIVESPFAIVVVAIGTVLTWTNSPAMLRHLVGIPILNVGIMMMIDRCIRLPDSVLARILNWRSMIWIGTASYSIYIWQQPWMFSNFPLWARLSGVLGCAAASFYLVERPLLKVRSRIFKWMAFRQAEKVGRELEA